MHGRSVGPAEPAVYVGCTEPQVRRVGSWRLDPPFFASRDSCCTPLQEACNVSCGETAGVGLAGEVDTARGM